MLRSLSEGASKYRQVQALSTSVHRQGRLVRERAAHRDRLAETRLCVVLQRIADAGLGCCIKRDCSKAWTQLEVRFSAFPRWLGTRDWPTKSCRRRLARAAGTTEGQRALP